MNPENFVGPAPGGGFVVYADGKRVGQYADQGEAERAFNTAKGASNAPARAPGLLPQSMLPTSPMSMVGGLDQLASQQAILNQQYLRQRLQDLEMPQAQATLSGYIPNAWKRAQASGRYNTKNGPKTLQEMRAEIVAASKA